MGHITHIDFGFMLMNSPGSVGFELAPFKMPQEYIDVLGGLYSEKFNDFRALCKLAFLGIRKRSETILGIVEIMEKGNFVFANVDSRLPCFTGLNKPSATGVPTAAAHTTLATQSLRERMQLGLTDDQCCDFVDGLIDSSCNNTFTALYDSFQYYANGIL
jgi:phosphatidylinositol kinase/protein kinase (PI-3  family)